MKTDESLRDWEQKVRSLPRSRREFWSFIFIGHFAKELLRIFTKIIQHFIHGLFGVELSVL
jgi:hypothetical protein